MKTLSLLAVWIVILATAALALSPATASAFHPPGDRTASNDLVNEVTAIASDYWAARDVNACPKHQLDTHLADDLSNGEAWQAAYGRGELGGCTVWFLSSLVTRAEKRRPGNDLEVFLCRTAVMEIGHTGGRLALIGDLRRDLQLVVQLPPLRVGLSCPTPC
jgi:hypothetical protein